MKDDKICINKIVVFAIPVTIILIAIIFFSSFMNKQSYSTKSKASVMQGCYFEDKMLEPNKVVTEFVMRLDGSRSFKNDALTGCIKQGPGTETNPINITSNNGMRCNNTNGGSNAYKDTTNCKPASGMEWPLLKCETPEKNISLYDIQLKSGADTYDIDGTNCVLFNGLKNGYICDTKTKLISLNTHICFPNTGGTYPTPAGASLYNQPTIPVLGGGTENTCFYSKKAFVADEDYVFSDGYRFRFNINSGCMQMLHDSRVPLFENIGVLCNKNTNWIAEDDTTLCPVPKGAYKSVNGVGWVKQE